MGTHKGMHEAVAKAASCIGAHGSGGGAHEPVAPVQIFQFSSLFQASFRLKMHWNLRLILFNLYCLQRPFKNY